MERLLTVSGRNRENDSGPELNVIMAKSPDDFIERSMDELLPFGFGPSNVAGNKAVED